MTMNELKGAGQSGEAAAADGQISLLVSPGGIGKLKVMPKVPEFIRENNNSKVYDPRVASFGPYHHGHQRLKFVEDFKPTVLDWFVKDSGKDENFWLGEVLEVINYLRDSYVKGSTCCYTDAEFAKMMLQDACLMVMSMKAALQETHESWDFYDHLGRAAFILLLRDLCLLENQIPFWFFKRILHQRFGQLQGNRSWRKFLLYIYHHIVISDDNIDSFIEGQDNDIEDQDNNPSHFVEALKRTYVSGWKPETNNNIFKSIITKIINWVMVIPRIQNQTEKQGSVININKEFYALPSVTELKARGITFTPNSNHSFENITFHHGFFYGKVKFPVNWIDENYMAIFSNIIAYEMLPNGRMPDFTITAYVHFMNTLLQTPEDVEELQNKGLIINLMGNDKHVMNLFNDIFTFRVTCTMEFHQVCRRLLKHYNSKARTWLAEFFHTYFRTPWTVITLIASVVVLFLSFVQAYYAAFPKDNNTK